MATVVTILGRNSHHQVTLQHSYQVHQRNILKPKGSPTSTSLRPMRGLGLVLTTNQMRECDQFKPHTLPSLHLPWHLCPAPSQVWLSERQVNCPFFCSFLDEGWKYSPHFQQSHTWPVLKVRTASCTHKLKKDWPDTWKIALDTEDPGPSFMLLINTRNMRPRNICIKLHHCCNSCHESDDSLQNSYIILCWAITIQLLEDTSGNCQLYNQLISP